MSPRAPRHSPLKSQDLSKASAKQLREQLRYELWQVKESNGLKNERLALDLGYQSSASVSKWLNGHDPLPAKCAEKLDNLGYTPTVGESFAALHELYVRASRKSGPRQAKPPQMYDLFLASPMTSLKGKSTYPTERKAARELQETLEESLNLTVYYAGENLETKDEFDSSLTAAERNFEALHNAKYFVMLSVSNAERPSSVTVEAGYALARGIPSLYLVRQVAHLPFVLRSLGQHEYAELPRVRVEVIESGRQAVTLIRKHGEEFFAWLDEPIKPRRRKRSSPRKGSKA